jgi:hypothetical protein|tara:strand:+ start:1247 stop:1483 length:237 start_codon:yes stop_codon:yes gene_type:complete
MTKEFFEIVLAKMINDRDMSEMDINNLLEMDISTDEKSDRFIGIIQKLTIINNNIKSLTGMVPEEVLTKPHEEDNNNN